MVGEVADERIALLLTALRLKGETVAEIAGAALALRRHMQPIRSERTGLLDTCGTGGDGSHTFNISTAAALVTAAAGVPVAKHGNRGMSSRSGSADALAALGVNVAADVPRVEECLDTLGICFCFAPLLHPAMKRVAEVRKRLGVPTIFNLLGPLSNPASAIVSTARHRQTTAAPHAGRGACATGNSAGRCRLRRRPLGRGDDLRPHRGDRSRGRQASRFDLEPARFWRRHVAARWIESRRTRTKCRHDPSSARRRARPGARHRRRQRGRGPLDGPPRGVRGRRRSPRGGGDRLRRGQKLLEQLVAITNA